MISLSPSTIQTFSTHVSQIEAASYTLRTPLDPRLYEDIEFVFICFTNRCGSNFIAQTLASDGQLNRASEWWNAGEIINVCRYQKLETLDRYIEGTCRFNMKSGRLLSKIGIENLVLLYLSGFFDPIGLRCRFLFINRADKLAQAISHVFALETSAWAYNNPATKTRAEVVYSRSKIDECLRGIDEKNRRFSEFFEMNGIVPTVVTYEDFIDRPDFYTAWVGKRLGIEDLRNVPANVPLQKQGDDISLEWHRRYGEGAD